MKKTHNILYIVSVIGFYVSLVLLYLNTASVFGTALLCISILSLALGVFFQWKDASNKKVWSETQQPLASEAVSFGVSC